VHISKDQGRTRPIGISATEDKVVQGALREVLEAVYERLSKEHLNHETHRQTNRHRG
jgi:hypothetical protein